MFNAEQEKQATNRHYRLTEISHALKSDELCLYYQPKVNMETGTVFGAEALIRWNHPEQGLIPPLDFLPILEGTDLEIQVGEWVINEALRQLELWTKQGLELDISINVSSDHLLSDAFEAQVEKALANYPVINCNSVQLEILESSAINDVHAISKVINSCRDNLGISFALDDFGTGYSSLTHLRNLPAEMIKIDQSFVIDILDDTNALNIIDGVINLADPFSRDVIAEGVETTDHGKMLLVMGCKKAQGYGISRPIPADEFSNWLQNYTPNQEWISCKAKHFSTKEKKLRLFILLSAHWYKHVETNIKSSPKDIQGWPIMERETSYYGFWFESAKKMQVFEPKWLNELEQAQVEIHAIAQYLRDKYENDHLDEARDGLVMLRTAFDGLNDVLALCNT